jgi:hypothetical protein
MALQILIDTLIMLERFKQDMILKFKPWQIRIPKQPVKKMIKKEEKNKLNQ